VISVAGWGANGGYVVGKPISIKCVIENRGSSEEKILLQDHHEYHGTLPFPTGMTTTVWDADGKVLAERWSQYVLWSTTFVEMPGDRITLLPSSKVTRIVPLEQVLVGSQVHLAAGTYKVRLEIPEAQSNVLAIVLKEEPNQALLPTPTAVTDPAAQAPRQP
jgi:hypothetical protein